ncbi:putative nuclease HARBI1 [Saccostrea echinata]|uniref:putative nuclease HARBI1 n=1 Tax=Saccostrea echinata TaxID=191078 RepID=UPI002A83A4F3|nr:putative nuclease HARBI1 [Saccostrea echinata]
MAAMIQRRRRRRQNLLVLRRPRVFRDLSNPLESLEEEEFFQRYRFSPGSILYIVNGVSDDLQADTARNRPIPPLIQVLLFLRFVATGAHLRLIGDSLNASECTTGRVVKAVARAIIEVFNNLIKFPVGEIATKVKEGFRRVAGFPKVLGCIDGTQIRIQTPSLNEPDYVNRKGFHSLNVQMVCSPTFKVTSLCARWPGSCHDSRIWRNSHLYQQFENGLHDGILLGDSGYPLTRHLMTPYLAPATQSEERYNASLCQTRVLIEQTFGIMKRRFQALQIGFQGIPRPSSTVHYSLCNTP